MPNLILSNILKSLTKNNRLINYGVPLATGLGTTEYAREHGTPLDLSLAYGAGAGMASSPRAWKNLVQTAKASPDPVGAFGAGALKSLALKGAPVATVAGIHYVPAILSQAGAASDALAQSSKNIQDTTGALAQAAPTIASDLTKTTGNIVDTASNASRISNELSGATPEAVSAIKSVNQMAGNVSDLTDVAKQNLPTLNRSLGQIGEGAAQIGESAKRVSAWPDQLKTTMHGMIDKGLQHKLALGLLLGGGALGTGWYLGHRKPKHQNT